MRVTKERRGPLIVAGVTLLCLAVIAVALAQPWRSPGIRPATTPTGGATSATTPTDAIAANNYSATLAAAEREAAIQRTAQQDVAGMTLDEKLGQMFLIETYYKTWTPDIANMVVGMHAGALIIYGKNMQDATQLHDYIGSIQSHATVPLLVTMDEEGGLVDRLGFYHYFPPLPAAQDLGATGNVALATQAGDQAAQEMQAIGINTDLAPVVDVRGPNGSVETTRLYSSDPATVTRFAGAYMDALQSHGVIATLKHWPGIGDVTQDPHLTLPSINAPMTQLEAQHFATFRALLAHQPGMIMVTHVLVNAVDPSMPATLSPKLVDGILRGELGYNGVVMTDSLYMQGIAVRYSLPEAGVLSVIAGDDLLEGAYDTNSMAQMIAALKAAIANGRISLARIDQSAQRILALKIRFGLLPLRDPHYPAHGFGGAHALAVTGDARRYGQSYA
ncbi:MAG TPA: glycoside hydrolase family 3 N-terminal domain-containing protein [Ktedonobacterales bacterium]|jgi:beta-N-acetylhexosaminidase|nr:glycoside hydrolase family 3 N-terminal domain-containing protein [Ktedonobacterales bacterium]